MSTTKEYSFASNLSVDYNSTFDVFANETSVDNRSGLPTWFFTIFLPLSFSAIIVTSLIGNGTVICVIIRHPTLKTVPNLYILNLASADFLFSLNMIFTTTTYFTKRWIFGEILCKIVTGIDGMYLFTGIFTLAAMSFDRYIAIVHAVWAQNNRSLLQVRVVCVILWLLSLTVTVPLWMYATVQDTLGTVSCNIMCTDCQWVMELFSLYSFVIGFILPLVVISICYSRIMFHLYLAQSSKPGKPNRQHSKLGRVGLMVLMAVAVFVACWMPFWTIRVYSTLSHDNSLILHGSFYCSQIMCFANCSLNPLVYAFFKQDLRRSLKEDLRIRDKQTKV
ncbi:somatostatin receptor type 1-like [Saccoglossus kowalevskii]|uniref:Somatostatin receptor type 1-like n=1 Tax=Saccoglossus kowalevskii TaxID=10224 RepID=A0ABM0GYX3_SACKO|nr:PREDICTED: somatostatin receptor type 1-like [Saccoglossus kowalevskii]